MFTSVKWTVFGLINKDIFKLPAWRVINEYLAVFCLSNACFKRRASSVHANKLAQL